MAITDGTEYDHHPERKKSKSHYDEVWDALEHTQVSMVGDHEFQGQTYRLVDKNHIKVGEVTFDNKNHFLGATFYTESFIAGRTATSRQAKFDLIRRIEETLG